MGDWSSKNARQWLEHSVLEQFPGTEKHHWDFKIEKDDTLKLEGSRMPLPGDKHGGF